MALSLVSLFGCSNGPPALRPPSIDPETVADEAITLYDKDGDGELSKEELKSSPGLMAALEGYDTDENGKISREEIFTHWQELVDRKIALTRLAASVSLDGKPLPKAKIRFIPDPYLGGVIQPASGQTGRRGSSAIIVDPEGIPENQRKIRGLQYGTYRVEITHPEIDIPAKYNVDTTLGYSSVPGNASVSFELKKR